MGPVDIQIESLAVCFLLIIIPVLTSFFLHLKLIRSIFISLMRMTVQLALIGLFLKYLFIVNNAFVNLAWVFVMIMFAIFTVMKSSQIKIMSILVPILFSFIISTLFTIFYVNIFVIKGDNIFDARYLVVLSGMLLGNTLRGNIIGINNFYANIKKDHKMYLYNLSLGATHFESILPYLQDSLQSSLKPTVATMATMGIVSLPGMMTGTILGGADPLVAIKYQIMIMIAIFVCVNSSVLLTILLSLKACFTGFGTLKESIMRK